MKELGKILVVDDSNQLRLLVDAFLSGEGYKVVAATSGEEALQILEQEHDIDLVLLDVVFPSGMSGFETLKQIRNQPQTKSVKVIMLTSSSEAQDIVTAFQAGAEDYITKPFRVFELKARVGTHVKLKQREDELANTNSFMKKVFKITPMRISIYNVETNQIEYTNLEDGMYLNQVSIEEYNTFSHDAKINTHMHPEDQNKWLDFNERVLNLSDEESDSIEFRRLGADNLYHWHRTYISVFERDEQKRVYRILTANIDINENKKMELALQKAHDELEERVRERTAELEKANLDLKREIEERKRTNAHLQATLNNNLQAFILLDRNKKRLAHNHVFEEMVQRYLQRPPTDENTLADLFSENGRSLFDVCFQEALTGKIMEVEINIPGQGGFIRWYQTCFTPSRTEDNEVMGVCVAMLDITHQKRSEQDLEKERLLLKQRVEENTTQLQEANANLLRANHAKNEFLATMSHELRSPLSAVLNSTEALMGSVYGQLNDQQMRVLGGIKESGQDLLTLINDILDISSAEAGKIRIELALVKIENVVNASVRLVQDQAQQKQIQISVKLDENVHYMMVDELRMKQMLVNLLTNAIKFTGEGGKIGLEVIGYPDKQMISFTVWDNGVGIPKEYFPKLFKPFEQVEKHQGQPYTGSGLGLYLVQKMADMHGGSIKLESKPGKGSRFTISLPWKKDEKLEIDPR